MAKLQAASMPIAQGGQLCAWGSYATGQTDGRIMISLNAPLWDHHHHGRVAGEGRRVVAPPCSRSTARLQNSPVGRVELFRSWEPLVPWTTRWATPRAVRRSVE